METGNLVVSRSKGEAIDIADGQIIVTVVDIRQDKVRISIQAPKDITVHRGEIAEAIRRERA